MPEREKVLPEFQEFLIAKKLVPEKYVSFYAHWVSRFLAFCNRNEDMAPEQKVYHFLERLRKDNTVADWQAQQAETAIKVYINNYLEGDISILYGAVRKDKHKAGLSLLREYKDVAGKMRDALRLRHYAYRTEQSYLDWVKHFFHYLEGTKRDTETSPLDAADVRNFLSYLALTRNVAASTQNQAFNALLFLFRNVLDIPLEGLGKTVRAKRGPKLPVVLTVEEVQAIFKGIEGPNLLMLQLLYGSGLRVMELVRLRVQDIDFGLNLIIVRSGKGDKDRSTLLPISLRTDLHLHLEQVKALHEDDLHKGYGEVYLPDALARKYLNAGKEWGWQYVFPSRNLSVDPRSGMIRRHHVTEKAIQDAMKNAVKKAGITKHATVHTLRHSFATHLLMSGVNIRKIQDYLGHKNLETTMIYTHVVRDMSEEAESPLDMLKRKNERRQDGGVRISIR